MCRCNKVQGKAHVPEGPGRGTQGKSVERGGDGNDFGGSTKSRAKCPCLRGQGEV